MLTKIDSKGNYLEYPGITIIAPIENNLRTDNLGLQTIYHAIKESPLLSRYYAPLPYKSYHVTTCNLYTKEEQVTDWDNFITTRLDFFQMLSARLMENQFIPQVSIEEVQTCGALQLLLELPENQRNIIESIAKEFNIEEGIPQFFHMTLAYEYKGIWDRKIYLDIKDEFAKIIANFSAQKIILKAPTLASFESMKKFTPWDGKVNPFNTFSSSKKTLGFFDEKITPKYEWSPSSLCTLL